MGDRKMIYKIGICDDEQLTCSELENMIEKFFINYSDYAEIHTWNSARHFKEDVPHKINLDILFLDIKLLDGNGVDIGDYIRGDSRNDGMNIIFISSCTNYALELFDIHPYNFYVKPLNEERIFNDLKSLLELRRRDKRLFVYRFNKIERMILLRNIVYFESDRKHIKIKCTNLGECIYVGQLKNELKKLPENFVMVRQDNIINLDHIKSIYSGYIQMDNGELIKISRNYQNEFQNKLMEYNKLGRSL